jgi:hypothetical protein
MGESSEPRGEQKGLHAGKYCQAMWPLDLYPRSISSNGSSGKYFQAPGPPTRSAAVWPGGHDSPARGPPARPGCVEHAGGRAGTAGPAEPEHSLALTADSTPTPPCAAAAAAAAPSAVPAAVARSSFPSEDPSALASVRADSDASLTGR